MEAVAVVGAVASIVQLVELIYRLSGGIIKFIDHFKTFSEDLRRLRLTVQCFRLKLEILDLAFTDQSNQTWLTPEIESRFKIGLLEVRKDVEAIIDIVNRYSAAQQGSISLRKKVLYHLEDHKILGKCAKHLESSEKNLQCIESTIHFYVTSLVHREICTRLNGNPLRSIATSPTERGDWSIRSRSSLICSYSLLRKYGFYGWHTTEDKKAEADSQNTFCYGICLPRWLMNTSVSLGVAIIITRLNDGLKVQCGFRVQNRVSINSPLMQACQKGNVTLIDQILNDKQGGVNDRSMCRGFTPLLVAIRAGHFDVVKYLLERDTDPNISDDDQVTPLFAAAGMDPSAHLFFEQYPPTWNHWFDAFRLLINHGAEAHENVRGRNLASLNIERKGQSSKTLDFLRLLSVEDSLQLEVMSGGDGWPAVHNALYCNSTAVDALKVLHSCGIQLSKVANNGRSALHMAAMTSTSADALEYLCTVGCAGHINRQDGWGWTPLHYAVAARNSAEVPTSQSPYSKVIMLLRIGADPTIRSTENALRIYEPRTECFTAFEFLKQVRPARFRMLVETLRNIGMDIEAEQEEEEIFYDFD